MLQRFEIFVKFKLDQSYRSVKIEKSRRVVESRPVCMDLKPLPNLA